MINRNEIELYLPPFHLNSLTPEIIYNKGLYYLDEYDNLWHNYMRQKSPRFTRATQIDLIFYSDYINSFIEYYTSKYP